VPAIIAQEDGLGLTRMESTFVKR